MMPRTEPLWAVTAYFNPAGYRSRLANYLRFRRDLAAPLVTVELSFDGSFALRPGDADVLVQLHGGDVMWQKERLLNVGFRHVPSTCDRIAWLDCDVVFDTADWTTRASRALDEWAIVHLFHERYNLPPGAEPDRRSTGAASALSSIYRRATGAAVADELSTPGLLTRLGSTTGLAWAGRRDVLERHGLYDANIIGSGDKATLTGALGEIEDGVRSSLMNPRRAEHYRAWAKPFFEAVRGSVGYLPGRIFHLWHGDVQDRRGAERHTRLAGFDPFTDIALDACGCWRWSSDKPDLHRAVRDYFASRREDQHGARPPT